jgi:hypothetical protein
MSTILDALRKLEEERQSRTADMRSRLLLSPAQHTKLLRRQRLPWKPSSSRLGVLSLTLAGFIAGAGLMLWRSYSPPVAPEQAATTSPTLNTKAPNSKQLATASSAPTQAQAPVKSPSPPTTQAHIQEIPPPPSAPQDVATGMGVAAGISPSVLSPSQETDTALASVSTVQRSPFVTPTPPPRETAPKSRSTTAATPAASPSEEATARDHLRRQRLPQSQPSAPDAAQGSKEAPVSTPSGTSLSFLQWSSDPERRIAFLRVNGGPLTMAHEGDTVGGYTVVEIRQNSVELQSGETHMTLHAR